MENIGMKKKITRYILVVVSVFLLAGAFLFGVKGHEGYYIETTKGFHILSNDNIGLVMMSSEFGDRIFEKYDTGDRIKIISGGIMESYPAQARVYFCIKLRNGDSNNIPDEVWKELDEYGCLE